MVGGGKATSSSLPNLGILEGVQSLTKITPNQGTAEHIEQASPSTNPDVIMESTLLITFYAGIHDM